MNRKEVLKKIKSFLILLGWPVLQLLKIFFRLINFLFLFFKKIGVCLIKKIGKIKIKTRLRKNFGGREKKRKKKKVCKIIFSQRKYKWCKWSRKWWCWALIILFLFVTIGVIWLWQIVKELPNVNEIYSPPKMSSKILDRNGKLLYKFYDGENRSWVPLSKIPDNLIKATLAIEDKEFYRHNGLSIKGIIKATWYNIRHKEAIRGGSTITQQLAKNVFLSREKTWKRKIKEIILALLLEQRLGKEQILERYFNQVPYGGDTYGVEEAAVRYFGKHVWELTSVESAYLAGLPAAPSSYSPAIGNANYAIERKKRVIDEMVKSGFINSEKAEEMKNEKIILNVKKTEIAAPHFVFYVRDFIKEKFGMEDFERQGVTVWTSLDLDAQNMAESVVKNEVDKINNLHVSNGAALITSVRNGDILAMVGSVQDQYNVTTALRQPGSSIKPINYLLALLRGWSVNSLIDDSPVSYLSAGSRQKAYTPQNYNGKYLGMVTIKTALASSLNIPSVKLLAENGVENMINLAEKMGISTWSDRSRFGLSLALGSGEVKMTELAESYGVFANLGERVKLDPILKMENYLGEIIYEKTPDKQMVVEGKYAFLINSILSDNLARAPVFGTNSKLVIPNKTVAVKTGTTNSLRDNWCIGWTPSVMVTTWVGNNDNTPMNHVASGVTGATPIWQKLMMNMLLNSVDEQWEIPSGVYKVKVCGKEDFYVDGNEKNIKCPSISPEPTR